MDIGNIARALCGTALIYVLSSNANAEEKITVETPIDGEVVIEGEVIKEDEKTITIETEDRVIIMPRKYIKHWEKDEKEEIEEKSDFATRLESSKKETNAGKPGAYFTLEEILKEQQRDWSKLPELTLDDLKRITMYPDLTIGKDNQVIAILPGKETKEGKVEINPYITYPSGRTSSVVKGKQFILQLAKFPFSPIGFSIKHQTEETTEGIPFPKDLVLIPNKNPYASIESLEKVKKNQTFLQAHEFPKIRDQIIGRITIDGQEYVVLDTYLFSKEKYENMFASPRRIIRYDDFVCGEVDLWREYFNLRGKEEKEIDAFHAKNGALLRTPVKLGGRNFTYVHYGDETADQIKERVERLQKAASEKIDEKLFGDYLVSGDEKTLDAVFDKKETLGEIIETLDSAFRNKTTREKDIKGWNIPLKQLIRYRQLDCDTGGKIALHALRNKGFPANFVFTYTKPILAREPSEWHAWVEVYVPDENIVVAFDANNPDRNYIFKADSKEKMDYTFDDMVSSKSGYVFQIPLNMAFDLE